MFSTSTIFFKRIYLQPYKTNIIKGNLQYTVPKREGLQRKAYFVLCL